MNETARVVMHHARAVFLRLGLEGARIEDICAASGVSVGSIYHHFGNKQGIAEAILVAALGDHKTLVRQRLADATSCEQSVREIVQATALWISQNADSARFVLRFRNAIHAAGSEKLKEHNRNELLPLLKRMSTWRAEGALRELPKEIIAPLLLGPLYDYAKLWLSGKASASPEEFGNYFAEAAWQSLKPTPSAGVVACEQCRP